MIRLRKKDESVEQMGLKELCARLWPFGKWCIVWKHVINGKYDGPKITDKLTAVNSYIMHQSVGQSAMKVIGVKKVGGLFNGIEYRPRYRTKEE